MFRLVSLILCLSLAGNLPAADQARAVSSTGDWSQVAAQAESTRLPVLLVVDSPDCGYCRRLQQEVLGPMHRVGTLRERAILRKMDLRTGGKVIDFDGEKIRAQIFLGRYEVFATPTVLFLDPQGRPLHEPIVGYNGADPYKALLQEAIDQSRIALGRNASATVRVDKVARVGLDPISPRSH